MKLTKVSPLTLSVGLTSLGLVLFLLWQIGPPLVQGMRWAKQLPACQQAFLNQADLSSETETPLAACIRTTRSLALTIKQSWLASHLVAWSISQTTDLTTSEVLAGLRHLPSDLETLHHELLTGNRMYVVLLQNSDELRATGGFPGTLATISLQNGQVQDIKMYDIFAPAGQLKGYKEPPLGVKEYLSGGQSWGLPDANWSPDFPTSAQTVLSFLGESEWDNVDGVVAVNVSFIHQILELAGPIWLPDYQQTITADNFVELARADRDTFFPGSYQKPQFLQALSTHLRLKLTTLSNTQLRQLVDLTIAAVKHKDLQIYSRQPDLEHVWHKWQLTGAWQPPTTPSPLLTLGWIESNVGINKANRGIDRSLRLTKTPPTLLLEATFTNSNTSPSASESGTQNPGQYSRTGHYINYQRLWLPSDVSVKSLIIGQQPQTTWERQLITLPNGQTVQEIGFVVTVAEQTQQTVKLELTLGNLELNLAPLWLWKQPGIPPTTYFLKTPGQETQLELTHDQLITW